MFLSAFVVGKVEHIIKLLSRSRRFFFLNTSKVVATTKAHDFFSFCDKRLQNCSRQTNTHSHKKSILSIHFALEQSTNIKGKKMTFDTVEKWSYHFLSLHILQLSSFIMPSVLFRLFTNISSFSISSFSTLCFFFLPQKENSCIKQKKKSTWNESVKIHNEIIYHFHHITSIEKVKPFGMSKRIKTFTK